MPSGQYNRIWYTIYAADDDKLLAYGDVKTCGRMLGKTTQKVHELISDTKSGRIKSYTVVREDLDQNTYEVFGEDNRGRNGAKRSKQMLELYRKGYNDVEIAEQMGTTPSKVKWWRNYRHLPSYTPPGNPNGFKQLNKGRTA